MIKTILLGSALVVTLSAAPVMADDFHALKGLQGAAPSCPPGRGVGRHGRGRGLRSAGYIGGHSGDGGVCLTSNVVGAATSANLGVANANAVTVATFLQVGG